MVVLTIILGIVGTILSFISIIHAFENTEDFIAYSKNENKVACSKDDYKFILR